MLDQATYTPRLKAAYKGTIRAAMKEEFAYKNDMQIPRLTKIVLNMGVGEAVKDTKKVKQAAEELSQIAGQKAVITKRCRWAAKSPCVATRCMNSSIVSSTWPCRASATSAA
jgi:hypothetical protein